MDSVTWRYDCGEVTGGIRSPGDVLGLTADQQQRIGCSLVPAALALRSPPAVRINAVSRVSIPATYDAIMARPGFRLQPYLTPHSARTRLPFQTDCRGALQFPFYMKPEASRISRGTAQLTNTPLLNESNAWFGQEALRHHHERRQSKKSDRLCLRS